MHWYWVTVSVLVVISVLLHLARVVQFDTSLPWNAWLLIAFVLLSGGWMAFDGGRALIVGDYVTTRRGQAAGTLGLWSKVVALVGIAPRSTLMKSILLVYGLAYLAFAGALVLGVSQAWWGVLVMAILGLWYVPFGTLVNILVILLLLSPSIRASVS